MVGKGALTRRMRSLRNWSTVRSDAEERTFSEAWLDVLIFRLRSYHVLDHVHYRW